MATITAPEEQRVLLRNISWETYERLLEERGEHPVPRYTYDRGMLEIMSPLSMGHEEYADSLRFIPRILARHFGLKFRASGSMTLQRPDIEAGVEPDASFYVTNLDAISGKGRLDMRFDPPPDLAIEVDVTNPTLDKLPLYARFGVPELWRFDSQRMRLYVLAGGAYVEREESAVFRGVTAAALSERARQIAVLDSDEWDERLRAWIATLALP